MDALINTKEKQASLQAPEDKSAEYLSPEEKDVLGEIGNMCMGASATTMYMLLNRRVTITTPRVEIFSGRELLSFYVIPFVAVEVEYTMGVRGKNLLLIKEHDAALITDLLMGGDGNVDDEVHLNEIHLSALSEIMNQMIGASATSLSQLTGSKIDISIPQAFCVNGDTDIKPLQDEIEPIVKISFDMEIEGVLKSELMQIMTLSVAMETVMLVKAHQIGAAPPQPTAIEPTPAPPPTAIEQAPAPPPSEAMVASAPPPHPLAQIQHMDTSGPKINVAPVVYPSFDDPAKKPAQAVGIDFIEDVPVHLSVQLGKTQKSMEDVLGFEVGTIISLNRLAGDSVDMFVNERIIARCEVVVIDEHYGVRIVEILDKRQ